MNKHQQYKSGWLAGRRRGQITRPDNPDWMRGYNKGLESPSLREQLNEDSRIGQASGKYKKFEKGDYQKGYSCGYRYGKNQWERHASFPSQEYENGFWIGYEKGLNKQNHT